MKPTLHSSKKLPALSKPNEEIQLDFIGPITERNKDFIAYLQWISFVNGRQQAFAKQLTEKQQSNSKKRTGTYLNGNSKTIGADKATAFTAFTG